MTLLQVLPPIMLLPLLASATVPMQKIQRDL